MKKRPFAIIIAGICLILMLGGVTVAKNEEPKLSKKEPKLYKVVNALGSKKEKKIKSLKNLSISECFEQLKELEFLLEDDYLNKAVYTCYKNNIADAIEYVIEQLKQPVKIVQDDENVIMNYDHYVAKAFMKVFALEAENKVITAYRKGDAETRANILSSIGSMASKKAKTLLIEALDDKTVYEETDPEREGRTPRRICDMAYDQLRLRYAEDLRDLAKTIRNKRRQKDRDDYIDELKSRF